MKHRSRFFLVILIIAISLAGCNVNDSNPSPSIQAPSTTLTSTQPPATREQPTQSPTTTPPQENSLAEACPLSGNGPYFAGTRTQTIIDQSRGNREIDLVIFYPAVEKINANGQIIKRDAAADMSGAPYPLVLTESNTGGMLISSQLASHGFVMVSIQIPDHNEYLLWDLWWPSLAITCRIDKITASISQRNSSHISRIWPGEWSSKSRAKPASPLFLRPHQSPDVGEPLSIMDRNHTIDVIRHSTCQVRQVGCISWPFFNPMGRSPGYFFLQDPANANRK